MDKIFTGKVLRQPLYSIPKKQLLKNLTVTLFSVIVLQMSAIGSIAQHITLKETNAPLTNVLNKISKQSGYFFLYDDATMHLAVPVEIEIQNASLDKALSILFVTQPFDYTIKGKTIVIKLRDNKPLNEHRDTVMPTQLLRITGIVSDAQAKPVEGVTISVKGTAAATRTDAQGYYSGRKRHTCIYKCRLYQAGTCGQPIGNAQRNIENCRLRP